MSIVNYLQSTKPNHKISIQLYIRHNIAAIGKQCYKNKKILHVKLLIGTKYVLTYRSNLIT